MMYDEHGVTIVTSKSSFLPEELERRISRGYYRGERPGVHMYICIRPRAQFEDFKWFEDGWTLL